MIWKRSRSHTCSLISAHAKPKIHHALQPSTLNGIFSAWLDERKPTLYCSRHPVAQWLSTVHATRKNRGQKLNRKTSSLFPYPMSLSLATRFASHHHSAHNYSSSAVDFVSYSSRDPCWFFVFRIFLFPIFLLFFFHFHFHSTLVFVLPFIFVHFSVFSLLCSFIFLSFTRSPGGIIKTFRCYFSCYADFTGDCCCWCWCRRLLLCRYFVRCSGIWFEK